MIATLAEKWEKETGTFSKTMKQTLILILFALAMPVHGDNSPAEVDPYTSKLGDPALCKEINATLTEIETIKPGQTRRDLLKLFGSEGGLTSRSVTRYVYLRCPFIKIDVTFKKVGDPTEKFPFNPDDKIITISKPYLEWSIID